MIQCAHLQNYRSISLSLYLLQRRPLDRRQTGSAAAAAALERTWGASPAGHMPLLAREKGRDRAGGRGRTSIMSALLLV